MGRLRVAFDLRQTELIGTHRLAVQITSAVLQQRPEASYLVVANQSQIPDIRNTVHGIHTRIETLVPESPEKYAFVDDQIASALVRWKPDRLHSFRAENDPRMFDLPLSIHVHDANRFALTTQMLDDTEVCRRYGTGELNRVLNWLRLAGHELPRSGRTFEAYHRSLFNLIRDRTVPAWTGTSAAASSIHSCTGIELTGLVSPNCLSYLPDVQDHPRRQSTLAFVGTPDTHKRLDWILPWLESKPGWTLRILGSRESDPMARLRSTIADQSALTRVRDQVVSVGRLTDAELWKEMQTVSALVVPSVAEGLCLPPLEASLMGTPVLASDIPPIRETSGTAPHVHLAPATAEGFMRALESALPTTPSSDELARYRTGHQTISEARIGAFADWLCA